MNKLLDTPRLPPGIDLAHEADFRLGTVRVLPSALEVAGEGWSESVEPRVMQVLVVLAGANGAVVSRDDLVEKCWQGRIVSEHAINRSIGKLRKLAEREPSFQIETIPRVGYRLRRTSPSAPRDFVEAGAPPSVNRLWKHGFAWVAGAGVVTALFAAWEFWPRTEPQWVLAASETLISTPLIEQWPSISPDGKMIAYSAGTKDANSRIFLRGVAAGEPLQLTHDNYGDLSPAWSPDGTRIAYVGYKPGEPCRIMIADIPAGSSREAARCEHDEAPTLRWSAATDALFFDDRPDGRSPVRIVQFDLATLRRQDVTHPPLIASIGDIRPAPSPDGRWVNFRRIWSDNEIDQVIRDLHSGEERIVTKDFSFRFAAWTEDSRTLLLTASHGSRDYGIWITPIDGAEPSRLTSSPLEYGRLAAGPKGLLASEVVAGKWQLAITSGAQGAPATIVETAPHEQIGAPSFAPDGTLAFGENRSGEAGIWTFSPEGRLSQLVKLSTFGFHTFGGLWYSPDGTKLAYITDISGRRGIKVVNSGGAEIAAIPFAGTATTTPIWDDDNRAILFAGRDTKDWRIWKADLAPPHRTVALTGYGWNSVAKRGSELFGTKNDESGVWRIGNPSRRLTPEPESKNWGDWELLNDEILYVDHPKDGPARIFAQPIAGGAPHEVAKVPNYQDHWGFDVDRRTGAVAYVAADNNTDIELLQLARK